MAWHRFGSSLPNPWRCRAKSLQKIPSLVKSPLTYFSILASLIAWLALKSVWSKRIGLPMITLILAVWLLGTVLLAESAKVPFPEWRQQIGFIHLVIMGLATWIPAGLAIALPGIFFRLRHQA